MRSVVVTGATGLIGQALIKCLNAKNIKIYAVCRPDSLKNKALNEYTNVDVVCCDVKSICKLDSMIHRKCDAFFHLAWLGTGNSLNRMDVKLQLENISCVVEAVNVANRMGCKVFIGAGSQAEYGKVSGIISPDTLHKPCSGYGIAKLSSKQFTRLLCNQFGMRHVWPRIVSIYGPNDSEKTLVSTVINKLMLGESPELTKCEQIWDYLYVDDAAEALYKLALYGKNDREYVLGSGKTKRLREFVEIIRDEIDPTLRIDFGAREYYPDQAMHLEADITTITEDTGWKPKYEFREGIREMLKMYRGGTTVLCK